MQCNILSPFLCVPLLHSGPSCILSGLDIQTLWLKTEATFHMQSWSGRKRKSSLEHLSEKLFLQQFLPLASHACYRRRHPPAGAVNRNFQYSFPSWVYANLCWVDIWVVTSELSAPKQMNGWLLLVICLPTRWHKFHTRWQLSSSPTQVLHTYMALEWMSLLLRFRRLGSG
jgi:hypothetical protein